MTELTPLVFADLLTVESILTLFLYAAMGAGWAYVGYRRNRAARGEGWESKKALSTFAAGGIVGLAIVLSGHGFDSGHVMALSGFLVPLIDKLWNAATKATTTATDMARDDESIPEIALEVAEVVDREVDVEDAMMIVAEYERRFGTLDPDPKHVEERATELKQEYDDGGPDKVYDRFGPEEAVEEDVDMEETKPERSTVPSRPVERSYIVEGPVVGPDPNPDRGGDNDENDGDDGDDNSDGTIHESA